MIISIITVSFNSEETIENTILSVINQDYIDIEYIIIDGKSTDNTIKIIQNYNDKISFWISEPDDGIYSAMNKGIKKATGDYVFFLNSDDTLYTNETISLVAKILELSNKDIVYGKIVSHFENLSKYIFDVDFSLTNLRKGLMPSHQAIFFKKKIFKKYGYFDLKYKSAADLDFLCEIAKNGIEHQKIDYIVSNFSVNGYSYSQNLGLFETLRIIKNKFGMKYYIFSLFKYIPIMIFRFTINKFGLMRFYRNKIYPMLLK